MVRCNNKDVIEKTVEQLKIDKNLKLEETTNKNPLVVLKNVLAYNSDNDILTALKNQNVHFLRDLLEEERVAEIQAQSKEPT